MSKELCRGTGANVCAVGVGGLRPGMVTAEDIESSRGVVLVPKGHVITEWYRRRLEDFSRRLGVREPVYVFQEQPSSGLDLDG